MATFTPILWLLLAMTAWSRSHSGCGTSLGAGQSNGGVSNVTIFSDDLERSYLIFIPPYYSPSEPTPVIFSYHGGNRDAEDQLELDQLTSPEFNTHAFVVYPQGIDNTWQGVPKVTTNDVQFTADILEQIESLYCIDTSRIYATGKSDGGGFCNVLACDRYLSTRFAAFAPVSGAYYINDGNATCEPDTVQIPCSPGRKEIPFHAFHGGNDTIIAYDGGARKGECLPSIPHFIQEWAIRDGLGCENVTEPVAGQSVDYIFSKGLVKLIYDPVIGHDWPSIAPNSDNQIAGHHPATFNATPIIMDFFVSHVLW